MFRVVGVFTPILPAAVRIGRWCGRRSATESLPTECSAISFFLLAENGILLQDFCIFLK